MGRPRTARAGVVAARAVAAIAAVALVSCSSSGGDAVVATNGSAPSIAPATDAAGTSSSGTSPTDGTDTTDNTEGTGGTGPTDPTGVTDTTAVADEITFGRGTIDLLDPTAGLDALPSYHASLTMSFTGTRAGTPETWEVVRDLVVSRDSQVRILTTSQVGTAPSSRQRIEIGRSRYEHVGDAPCEVTIVDPDEPVFVTDTDPAVWLPAVRGAEDDGAADVGGVPARHATFDERAFGSLDPATSIGEVWTATDGGHVLRMHVETTGGSGFLGHDATGTLTIDYTLDAIGTPVSVDVPADCGVGMIDAPLPPDAHDVALLPGVTAFLTATAPVDVVAFYEQQLPAAGWQPDGDVMIGADGTVRAFVRGAETFVVFVRAEGDSTGVTLAQDRGIA